MGALARPGLRKKFRCNLQAKFVSAPQHTKCTPEGEQESILRHFCFILLGGRDLEVHIVPLNCLLRFAGDY